MIQTPLFPNRLRFSFKSRPRTKLHISRSAESLLRLSYRGRLVVPSEAVRLP